MIVKKLIFLLYKMNRLPTGSPNFKGARRQHRQSDYDLKKAVLEFVDNVITKCNNVNVVFGLTDLKEGTLSKLSISDDYPNGFENMFQVGTENPFNMTHMRSGQDDDDETSQFGIGMKAGAISTGDRLDVFTKVNGQCYWIEMDFLEMCEREEDTFSPNVREISEEEYHKRHPFEYGSTLVISSINPSIYKHTTANDLKAYLKKELSDTYNDIIKNGVVLKVNDDQIHYTRDIYDDPECRPFTRIATVYKNEDSYYMFYDKYYVYKENTERLNSFKKKDFKIDMDKSEKIATITSTFTFYHPNINKDNLPYGEVQLYRKGRRYGCWTGLVKGHNGIKNYNLSRIDFDRKEIAKKLGLTYNKNISEIMINLETITFRTFVNELTKSFSSDTASPANLKLYKIAIDNNIFVDNKKLPKNTEPPAPPEPAPPTQVAQVASHEPAQVAPPEPVSSPAPVASPEPVASPTQVAQVASPAQVSPPAPVASPEPVSQSEPSITQSEPSITQPEPETFEDQKSTNTLEKKPILVSSHIKGSLTDDQLENLLKKDKTLLKTHPAMIRAYNEIM